MYVLSSIQAVRKQPQTHTSNPNASSGQKYLNQTSSLHNLFFFLSTLEYHLQNQTRKMFSGLAFWGLHLNRDKTGGPKFNYLLHLYPVYLLNLYPAFPVISDLAQASWYNKKIRK